MIEYYLNNVVVKELWYPLTFTMFTYDKMKPNFGKNTRGPNLDHSYNN